MRQNAEKISMGNQRGFSLTEMAIATACTLLLVFGASTLATQSMRQHQHALGKLDSIQQNSEIKDLMFNFAGANPTSCKDRLGITSSSPAFTPGVNYQLPLHTLPAANGSKVEKMYLVSDSSTGGVGTLLQANGINKIYSAQLRVEQKLSRGIASVAPVTLGVMNVTVDSSNKIIGCNWDETTVSPMQFCTSSDGTVATSGGCFMEPNVEILTDCPTGTAMAEGRCVATNVNCYNQHLGDKFDGYKMGCATIPPTYTVRYPAGYTPPAAPGGESAPHSASPHCTCGSYSIPAGGSQLCIKGWSEDEWFGNYNDMWQVKRCNSAGQLEGNSPNELVYYEEGEGINFGFRPGSCTFTNQSKYVGSQRFTVGRCE